MLYKIKYCIFLWIFSFFALIYLQTPTPPSLPVHTGVCSVIVEGALRTDTALFTLLPTVLRDGEGGAAALAGGHTGAILHGGRTGDGCKTVKQPLRVTRSLAIFCDANHTVAFECTPLKCHCMVVFEWSTLDGDITKLSDLTTITKCDKVLFSL